MKLIKNSTVALVLVSMANPASSTGILPFDPIPDRNYPDLHGVQENTGDICQIEA